MKFNEINTSLLSSKGKQFVTDDLIGEFFLSVGIWVLRNT